MTGGEILGYFKNGEFRGFGGGVGPYMRGSRGLSPFASLSPLLADFSYVTD